MGHQEGPAGGVAMQMGAAGDRPDFAIAERASDGNLGKGLPAGAHIPIPLAIEPLAPAQAGKTRAANGAGCCRR